MVTKDLPHLSPVHALRVFIAMTHEVQHSSNSSTNHNGWILLTHVLTLSVTEEKHTNSGCKNRTHDFRTRRCSGYLLFRPLGLQREKYISGGVTSPPYPLPPTASQSTHKTETKALKMENETSTVAERGRKRIFTSCTEEHRQSTGNSRLTKPFFCDALL